MLVQTTVADLTERELVARIQSHLPPAPSWMLVGIGDDAAVVEAERGRAEVLSVDALVEGVHFDRAFVPPDAVGHRALAVNLSDLAAMGAAPRLALLSMALPRSLTLSDFDEIIVGFAALAVRHRVHVAGGNLTRSPGPLVIDVTVAGTVKPRQALTRSGARVGDDVYVSGSIGAAAAGLKLLREGAEVASHQSPVAGQQSPIAGLGPQSDNVAPESGDSRLATGDWRLATAYLRPEPRVRLGVLLGRNRAASACIDLSDGLADGIHQIAEASGVGMTVERGALPFDDRVRRLLGADDEDATLMAMTGGDDYELLFTARPRSRRLVAAVAKQAGVDVSRIGACTRETSVLLRAGGGARPVPAGFSHFR